MEGLDSGWKLGTNGVPTPDLIQHKSGAELPRLFDEQDSQASCVSALEATHVPEGLTVNK